jgi:hypothetical protein
MHTDIRFTVFDKVEILGSPSLVQERQAGDFRVLLKS